MELAVLGSGSVLRDADVVVSRERSRQLRLRRLVVVLAVVAVPVIGRTAFGIVRYWQGNYAAAAGDFHWPHPGIPSSFLPYLPGFLLIVILAGVMAGPLLMAGRSPHVLYRPEEIGITLADVVGAPAVVEEVVKTLNLFLAHRTFSEGMGGTPRRAILFEGPPGTGKTYIAKAMAAEAGVPFLYVSSSAFQSMYYGQTNRKIRSYFRALQKYAWLEGGAIGFIEEIDAIGATRGGMGAGPGREGIAGVVNELLIQLQSFDVPPFKIRALNAVIDVLNRWLPPSHAVHKRTVKPANFLVVGATNRAADLDPALLRPGRFDRTIRVDVPNRGGRREIIDYYLARKAHLAELDDDGRRDALAGSTFGYSPVMLEHLFDEALVWALRAGRTAMNWADVSQARMTAELGLTQPVTYTQQERLCCATHEAGHATVAYFAAPNRRLDVLSIIKRSESLGLLSHSETEERFTRTRSECEALLRISMGGMVAEEIFFGEATTGPAGDLSWATRLAAQMVGTYGMAGSLISLDASRTAGDIVSKALSDEASRQAMEGLLGSAREAARDLLLANSHVVEALRDALVERDELLGDEITDVIVGVIRPGDLDKRGCRPGHRRALLRRAPRSLAGSARRRGRGFAGRPPVRPPHHGCGRRRAPPVAGRCLRVPWAGARPAPAGPFAANAIETSTAACSPPITKGTIGEATAWPGYKRVACLRSRRSRSWPSAERSTPRAAPAAAALAGAKAVVKMNERQLFTSISIITRRPATKPPWLPRTLDNVPTRSTSHGSWSKWGPSTAWASSSTKRAPCRAHVAARSVTGAASPSIENTESVTTTARPVHASSSAATSRAPPWG